MKKFFTLITVAMLAFAAQANELSVCDGLYYSGAIPVNGYWYDTPGMTQQIYPAEMLAEMAGGQITELTFYTLAALEYEGYDFSSYVIGFNGGKLTLSLMEVEQNAFTEATPLEGAQVVATLVPEAGGIELKFVLDEPFAYHGGNLMVQVDVTEVGVYGTTRFWGTASEEDSAPTTTYVENYNYYDEVSTDLSTFLCRATFAYTFENEPKFYVCGGFNEWDGDNPIEITEEGATFDVVEDPNNSESLEFKILTAGEDDWLWLGGIDENGVGYFDITEDMLTCGTDISLYDDGANFRLPCEGNYTITLFKNTDATGGKALFEGVKIVVKRNDEPTSINDIKTVNYKSNIRYNVMGQPVGPDYKGFVIENGRKLIIK